MDSSYSSELKRSNRNRLEYKTTKLKIVLGDEHELGMQFLVDTGSPYTVISTDQIEALPCYSYIKDN